MVESFPMTSRFRAIMFDLDGTLADTLADLANATNAALAHLGCPTHPVESYRLMVGDGARQLCTRALPADRQTLVEDALRLMRQHYDAHCFDLTRLYPGITEVVGALGQRGFTLAVLSNKPDDFTRRMIAHYFGSRESPPPPSPLPRKPLPATIGPFDIVRGQRAGVPLKPDPTSARQIADELAIPPSQWLYLGDTNTDMRTARAAGMHAGGVLWGFRDRAELEQAGAQTIVAEPTDLLGLADL
jgi:phosphoglycolate phosphatase